MLDKIINYSLHNRLLIIVLAILFAGAGAYTAWQMEIDVFPDLNAPTVVVMTEAPGMATEEVENSVTFHIETALNGATGVRRVRSSSTNGFSVVWVEFNWKTDIYKARQIVSEKLAAIGESLPATVGQPVLGPQSSILGEMMIIGLTSDSRSLQELRSVADRTVRPRLLSTAGVAQVTVIGGDIKEYQIRLAPRRMGHYGVTLAEVEAAVRDMNINASGGVLYEYGNEYVVRGMLAVRDTALLAAGVVKLAPDGTPVTIGDIADVVVGSRSPQLGVASERGVPAVLITVTKQPDTNTLELTEQLDRTVETLRRTLPDVHISTDIFRQSRFIESAIHNIGRSLWEGALFVVVILFFFLMNGRVTLISLIALPLSLLVAVLALNGLGFTLNTMSLGGMAIAIGSLVDDAIIDVENVYKRLRENYALPPAERQPALRVVYDASREIRASIVNATLITIAAFIPLFFLDGMEGRMLRPLGISFIVSLFASMVVAVTLTPVLCSCLLTSDAVLQRHRNESVTARFFKRIYRRALQGALRRPRVVIGGAVVLAAAALALYTTLGSSFLPPFNEGSLTVNISTLPGISLDESDKIGRLVENVLLEVPEIETVARKTGRAELDEHALGVNSSELEAPFVLADRSREEFLADVRSRLAAIKGIDVEIGQPVSHRIDAMLSGTQANIAVKLFGEDLNRMYALGQQIKRAMGGVEGITDIRVEQQVERAQLQIVPRREMLARYGITLPDFARWVKTALEGETVSQIYEDGVAVALTLKAGDSRRLTIDEIKDLPIDTGTGGKVALGEVARVVSTTGPNTINRENVRRRIVVSANITGGDLGGAVAGIQHAIAREVELPEGYYIEYGGQFESRRSAARTLTVATLFALLVIFLLLFREFRSTGLAGVVLLNLPLALIGGVVAVALTSGVVSIPAVIGFISLLGIAVRNGILLVSHYGQLRREGRPLYESIVVGSLDRLNPILMTSLTSALALIPLALGGSESGNEIQSPMAQVILGGLVSSTLLNGFVIPAVYLLMNTKKENHV